MKNNHHTSITKSVFLKNIFVGILNVLMIIGYLTFSWVMIIQVLPLIPLVLLIPVEVVLTLVYLLIGLLHAPINYWTYLTVLRHLVSVIYTRFLLSQTYLMIFIILILELILVISFHLFKMKDISVETSVLRGSIDAMFYALLQYLISPVYTLFLLSVFTTLVRAMFIQFDKINPASFASNEVRADVFSNPIKTIMINTDLLWDVISGDNNSDIKNCN